MDFNTAFNEFIRDRTAVSFGYQHPRDILLRMPDGTDFTMYIGGFATQFDNGYILMVKGWSAQSEDCTEAYILNESQTVLIASDIEID